MTLLERVDAYIGEHGLIPKGAPVLVAVSGGVDSVVVAHVLRELGYHIGIVHLRHGLRGSEAEADAALVLRIGEDWDVRVHDVDIAPDIASGVSSVQAEARRARYEALVRISLAERVGYVATGHQRDDQAETVLQHLLRGTGVAGLAGMPRRRLIDESQPVSLVRPLLAESRADIEAYARENGLAWREDSSNASESYRRNLIRSRVLPVLNEATEGDAAEAIVRAADLLRAYGDADVTTVAHALCVALSRPVVGEGALLHESGLAELPPVWRRRVYLDALSSWLPRAHRDHRALERIDALRVSQPGRRIELKGGAVWRERTGLAFVRESASWTACALPAGTPVRAGGWTVRRSAAALHSGAGEAWAVVRVPADSWTVRPWRPGDRMHPAGGPGERKVKALLTEAHIPTHARSGFPVVEADGAIVWVVGLRPSEAAASASGPAMVLTARPDPGFQPD